MAGARGKPDYHRESKPPPNARRYRGTTANPVSYVDQWDAWRKAGCPTGREEKLIYASERYARRVREAREQGVPVTALIPKRERILPSFRNDGEAAERRRKRIDTARRRRGHKRMKVTDGELALRIADELWLNKHIDPLDVVACETRFGVGIVDKWRSWIHKDQRETAELLKEAGLPSVEYAIKMERKKGTLIEDVENAAWCHTSPPNLPATSSSAFWPPMRRFASL